MSTLDSYLSSYIRNDCYSIRCQKNILGFEFSQFKIEGTTDPYVYGFDHEKNTAVPLPFRGYSQSKNDQTVAITTIAGDNVKNLPGMATIYNYFNKRFVPVYGNIGYTGFNRRSVFTSSYGSNLSKNG